MRLCGQLPALVLLVLFKVEPSLADPPVPGAGACRTDIVAATIASHEGGAAAQATAQTAAHDADQAAFQFLEQLTHDVEGGAPAVSVARGVSLDQAQARELLRDAATSSTTRIIPSPGNPGSFWVERGGSYYRVEVMTGRNGAREYRVAEWSAENPLAARAPRPPVAPVGPVVVHPEGFHPCVSPCSFESIPKHPRWSRETFLERVSSESGTVRMPEPSNPQNVLEQSWPLDDRNVRRIAIDCTASAEIGYAVFAIFDMDRQGRYHGHTRAWSGLRSDEQAVLTSRMGVVDHRGRLVRSAPGSCP